MAQKLKIDIVAKDRSKQALGRLQGSLAKVKASVFNLRNAFIGLGAGLVIKGIVDAGIQVEMLGVQLKSLMGSATAGKKALKDILDFAKTTPFELKNIQQGVTSLATVRKQAAAAGIDFKELMTITGNTATLLGGDFALAATQIQRSFGSSIGAADLFRDRGVSAMAGFTSGVSYNAQQSIAGLSKSFGTGGEFGNMMNDLAQTLFGTISNLKDAFFRFQVYISEAFFGELKKQFGDLKTTIEDNEGAIKRFGTNVGEVFASSIRGASSAMQFLAENIRIIIETLRVLIALKIVAFFYNLAVAIGVATGAMLTFNASVRKNLLIGGAVLVISQLDRIIKKFKELTGLFGDKTVTGLHNPFNDAKETVKEITEEIKKQEAPVKSIREQFEELNKGSIAKIEEQFKNINTTIAKGVNSGITKMSDGLARALILGEKLSDTFKKMAQELLVRVLSKIIDIIARKGVELALEKLITREKEKQWQFENAKGKQSSGSKLGTFLNIASMFMASGGAVSKGKPVVVGERGPELFVPNQSGQITQNARGTGGGGSTNVNFNITTLDARGFDQMLVQNRGTITQIINQAVNERGSKNLI
jgi:gas vesicle protein